MKRLPRPVRVALATVFLATVSPAQTPPPKIDFPAPSPSATLKQRVGLTDIEIVYSRPGVKGRKIFGGLEPWGETWRAGANNATKVTFSTPVKFGGVDVPAGSYGLFARLGEDEWEVILNRVPGQWGAYKYDAKDDIARVKAKPQKLTERVETFTIDLNDIRDESATLNLTWENTRVAVPLQFDVVSQIGPQIEAAMATPDKKTVGFYQRAADFYFDHNLDLKKAVAWMDAALAQQPDSYFLLYHKARILAKAGDKAAAVEAAKKSIELAQKDASPAKEEYTRLNEALLATLK
ncbi:MAG TPA: DUF2911 domain-containing protein [Opitutaceae bacterium]|nr:DUF2911 domain-containing protein [Opitutaceae bacterium]